MAIRDEDIRWARQRMYIPVWNFAGYLDAGTIAGVDTGAPVLGELASFGYTGLVINADNDAISHLMSFPSMWDIEKEIGIRVRWAVDATVATSDTITWTFVYDQADVAEQLGNPSTALDTVLVEESPSSTITLANYRSPRGIIAANTFDAAAIDGMFGFTLSCVIGANPAADEIHLLGIDFDYYPRWTIGGTNPTEESRSA